MATFKSAGWECGLALKFAAVSLLGFATDASLLHLGLKFGLQPAWARVISLFCAMQVTFAVNRKHVFRAEAGCGLWRQWASYMASNGFGNFCNYWIFVTLVSLHRPMTDNRLIDLCIASFCAWMMNYACARLVVFRTALAKNLSSRPSNGP
jgi:putative flippase GtrA